MPLPTMPILPVPSHPTHEILDSSKLKDFLTCPRKFFFKYVLGWKSAKPNNHLVFGQAVHLALEHIIYHGYTVDVVMEALELFNNVYREHFPEETDELYLPKTPERFFLLLTHYLREYADDLEKYEVYQTELGGTIFIGPDHQLAWKMDTILYNKETGLYFSLEHKTKQANFIEKFYALDFEMGPQVGTYTHVLNSLFKPEDVEGVTINCLCFKKTKSPDFILERFPIRMSPTQMLVWMETTKTLIDEIYAEYEKLSLAKDTDPVLKCFRCNGESCSKFYKVCQYHTLCTSWPNPLQHLHQMPVGSKVEFWNPLEEELKEVIEL